MTGLRKKVTITRNAHLLPMHELIKPQYPASNELGGAVLEGILGTNVTWYQPRNDIFTANSEVVYTADVGSEVPISKRTRVVVYPETRRAVVGRTVHGKKKAWLMWNVSGIDLQRSERSGKVILRGTETPANEDMKEMIVSISLTTGERSKQFRTP